MELTKLLRPSLIAVLFLPILCAAGTEEDKPGDLIATALPFCQMMAEPARYIGSKVAISALVANTPHGGMIYGNECQSWAYLRGAEEGRISPQAKAIFADGFRHNSNARFQVMVIGVLRSTGARYLFEESRIIVALPLDPDSAE